MATDLFNNLSSTSSSSQGASYLSTSPNNGQSFTNTATAQNFSSLTLSLLRTGSTSGTLTAYLYSYANNLPASNITALGTIANSTIGTTAYANYTINVSSAITLAPNASYYIVLQDSFANDVAWNYTTGTSGTGVAGTYYTVNNSTTSNPSSNANNNNQPWIMQVTSNAVCFVSGTLIRTVRGEVAVEDLLVGDLAVTASGAHRPIRWIGHRTIDLTALAEPHAHVPVRVVADAFGPGLPARDLLLSAGHSVRVSVIDDLLIPIGKLVNGATIRREAIEAHPTVTYWHVELDSHDVLLAQGLPAESFLDCGNRTGLLEQEGEYDRTKGPYTPADFCLPYVDAGPVLAVVRDALIARAERMGWRITRDMDPHLVVDGVRVDPDVDGGTARFFFPATARSVVLASATCAPSDLADGLDHRSIGLSVSGIEAGDGLRADAAWAAGDARLSGLFHPEEATSGAGHRFTRGWGELPSELWAGCRMQVVLRLHFDPASGGRWLEPESADDGLFETAPQRPHLALVA